ncbi:hypothetical protein DVS28_b0181 (plasmid) [Euzebya pacifica]|uniref:Uncharacterized protein n=1 Tax=Euzebya pacifica TaxID=1608957 RepID=A0A346Y654_9ACTN|nr:hypothetical protein [Euzebya pacifica]AXV09951.1 hypothetical protein DVS28_b0181 [Euzebya pacifica]
MNTAPIAHDRVAVTVNGADIDLVSVGDHWIGSVADTVNPAPTVLVLAPMRSGAWRVMADHARGWHVSGCRPLRHAPYVATHRTREAALIDLGSAAEMHRAAAGRRSMPDPHPCPSGDCWSHVGHGGPFDGPMVATAAQRLGKVG